MAIVPLRAPRGPLEEPLRPKVERYGDQEPSGTVVQITMGDDGLKEIKIGGDEREVRPQGGPDDDFDRNLAADFDDTALSALASYLIEGIEADEEGRRDWEDTANMAANYLGIKLTDPVSAVAADGTVCQAVATCMLEVAIKLWGTARAELLPVGGPVKVQRLETPPPPPEASAGIGHNGGPPMDGGIVSEAEPGQPPQTGADEVGDDLADALERDLNWYLTVGDKGYYPDFSKMLMNRSLIGPAFREVFRCPVQRKPLSRWVMAQDLIVSGDPPSLGEAGRVTKRAKVRQALMKRLQTNGHYLNVPLVHPTGITTPTEIVIGETQGITPTPTLPRDFDHTVYECYCELGSGTAHDLFGSLAQLDEDETGKKPGYPLPYAVAIDYDSRTVLAIRRNWKQGDPDHRARRRFVKYGFVPGFGFYDWGLIHIAGNPTQAATMLQRSGVDASLFVNFPAWAIAQGVGSRLESTVFRPNPGEGVKIPVASGAKLADVLMPWPYRDASPQSIALNSKLEGDVRKLAGVIDLPVGEGRIGNTPVGTIMSYIESVTQVQGAVHKDDHIAQQEEFELLRDLIAEEPEVLWRGNKNPARKWQVADELLSPDLAPRADPNTPSQIHRLTKVQGLVTLAGQQQFALGDKDGPIVNQRAIYRRAVEVLSGDDADQYTLPPQPPSQQPPPPDPRIVAAQIKAQSDQAKTQGQIAQEGVKHQDRMAELAVESQNREADRQSDETRAALSLAAAKVKTAGDGAAAGADRQHEAQQNALDRSHEAGLQAMDHAATAQQQALSGPLTGDGKEGE